VTPEADLGMFGWTGAPTRGLANFFNIVTCNNLAVLACSEGLRATTKKGRKLFGKEPPHFFLNRALLRLNPAQGDTIS